MHVRPLKNKWIEMQKSTINISNGPDIEENRVFVTMCLILTAQLSKLKLSCFYMCDQEACKNMFNMKYLVSK